MYESGHSNQKGEVDNMNDKKKNEVIKLINVSKVYRMGEVTVRALHRVNLTVQYGEFLSIMGPSGSGKSTLLNIIGCIDIPTYGRVFIEGVDVSKLSDRKLTNIRLKKIGFIFQQFYLIPTLTAYENVEIPMKEARLPKRERSRRVRELLRSVGLEDRMKHYPNQLSGGEQQRVAIARALANNPIIVLADEPTGELDTKNKKKVMSILKQLNEEKGITTIVVTHDMQVASIAKRLIKIIDGEIFEDMEKSEDMKKC